MSKQNHITQQSMLYRACALGLIVSTACSPAVAAAAPVIPGFSSRVAIPSSGQLPQGGVIVSGTGSITPTPGKNELVINQNSAQAIINWEKFDIGAAAAVRFNQGTGTPGNADWKPNSSYAALNRINDINPSAIFGKLTADGKVYLINRNGIMFGAGSQVNVHALTASALNITDENFKKSLLRFTTNYNDSQGSTATDATISNYGTITTDNGGSVFFVGPRVENAGTISSPAGKINLVAVKGRGDGTIPADGEVEITELAANDAIVDVVFSDSQVLGEASNLASGKLIVNTGRIGMYGATVQQDGLIRSVTARNRGGVIYLAARDKISTGVNSITETPVSDAAVKAGPSLDFSPGSISLTAVKTVIDSSPLQQIEHLGTITSPSGTVAFNATTNVTLGETSIIDVSGLLLNRSASANLLDAQLNSVYLRDEYSQKDGFLKGVDVKIDKLGGSTIGNLSTYYLTMPTDAQEQSTRGGTISIQGSGGGALESLIARSGSLINFSGGGITYAAGSIANSKLISGNQIYDFSTAPKNIQYDRLADSQKKTYARFGITEEFKGLYFGGGSSVGNFVAGRSVGDDAGRANLAARFISLDGVIRGGAKAGLYQTAITSTTTSDTSDAGRKAALDANTISRIRGLEKPSGGTLQLGSELGEAPAVAFGANLGQDAVLSEVVITAAKPEPVAVPDGITRISAEMLNNANLGSIGIFANNSITIDPDVRLSLLQRSADNAKYTLLDSQVTTLSGGNFTARARRIDHQGDIEVPGGLVSLGIRDTISAWKNIPATGETNPFYQSLVETINLADKSIISVAGQRVDNSAISGGAVYPVITTGGSIQIVDASFQSTALYSDKSSDIYGNTVPVGGHAVNLAQGALLDVSGGYLIDAKGKINGGDAGSLTLKAPTLIFDGEVRGYSLPGKNGGAITLHAGEVVVEHGTSTNTDPEYLRGKLVLGDNRLADTGFSRISLVSINSLNIKEGAILAPSTVKSPLPQTPIASQAAGMGNTVTPANSDPNGADYLGKTSIELTAGQRIYKGGLFSLDPATGIASADDSSNIDNVTSVIGVAVNSAVTAAPGGTIRLAAPVVDIAGTLAAPGGGISITANNAGGVANALTLESTGRILAGGYLKPGSSQVVGLPAGPVPMAGGTVSLISGSGINLVAGSKVDVSAPSPVERIISGKNGTPEKVVATADPGGLTLEYGGTLTLDGELDGGRNRMSGVRGGTLTITKTNQDLNILEKDINLYQQSGFDALTFTSKLGSLILPEKMDVEVGRSLTLDGQLIQGQGGVDVTLRSPWIRLTNKNKFLNTLDVGKVQDKVNGTLTLKAGFIDVEGQLLMNGFSSINLDAESDIRFSNQLYSKGTENVFGESLGVTGDLTLRAGRIYPGKPSTYANFSAIPTSISRYTITSNGTVTTRNSASGSDPNPIYSAGGGLTIVAAGGIEHRGTLVAPQGSITLIGGTRETVTNSDGTVTYKDTPLSNVYLAEGSSIVTGGSVPVSYGTFDGQTWTVRNTSTSNNGETVSEAPLKSINLTGKEVVVKERAMLDLSGGGGVYNAWWQSGIQGTYNPLTISKRYVILPDHSVTLPGQAVYLGDVPSLGLKAGVYSVLPAEYAFVPGALVIEDTGLQMAAGQKAFSSQGYTMVAGYDAVTGTSINSRTYKGFTVRNADDVRKEGDFSSFRSIVAGNGGDLNMTATSSVMNGTLGAQPLSGYMGGVLTLNAKNIVAQNGAAVLPDSFSFGDSLSSITGMADKLIVDTLSVSEGGFREVALGTKAYNSTTKTYEYLTDTVTVTGGSTLHAPSVTLRARTSATIESNAQVQATGVGNDGTATVDVAGGSFYLNNGARIQASNALRLDAGGMTLLGDFGAGHSLALTTSGTMIFGTDPAAQPKLNGLPQGIYLSAAYWDPANSTNLVNYDNLTLISRGGIDFQQGMNMTAKGAMTLDVARYTASDGVNAAFTAGGRLTLLNSGTSRTSTGGANSSSLTFTAAGIDIAPRTGGIIFDQIGTLNMNSTGGDITLQGAGTVTTARDLNINAPRVTTSFYKYDADPANKSDVSIPYTPANVTIDAGSGTVSIAGNGVTAGTASTPGGSMEFRGAKITVGDSSDNKFATVLDSPTGQVTLTATGDISILDKSRILATGSMVQNPMQPGSYSYYDGGRIALQSSGGAVMVAGGSMLDVSAASQGGDAGSISLTAATAGKGVSINQVDQKDSNGVTTIPGAQLKGKAGNGGNGGSFIIDSDKLDAVLSKDGTTGLDGLSNTLADGGFNNQINIRSRSDNKLTLTKTLTGREVIVAADGGAIDLYGTINADGTKVGEAGGRVELYAGTSLTLENGSVIHAAGGPGALGGTVALSSLASVSTAYALEARQGSAINVSGGTGGTDGTVAFRAYQINGNDVNMAAITDGTIIGASKVSIEAARSYQVAPTSPATSTTPANSNIGAATTYLKDANDFIAAASATAVSLSSRLFGNVTNHQNYHLLAGIELVSADKVDLTLNSAWNLSAIRPGGEAGIVTLRAGGNLLINQNLFDAPTSMATLYSTTMQSSWGINLIAGAGKANGANYRAVELGTGNLTIGNGKVVYSENAPIYLAAGNDVTLGGWSAAAGPGYMINTFLKYNLGSYGGTVRGVSGNNLNLNKSGSIIQTALGNIDLRIGNNLDLGSDAGAIRTTGEYAAAYIETAPQDSEVGVRNFNSSTPSIWQNTNLKSYWYYHNGGNIRLDVGQAVNGTATTAKKYYGWDALYLGDALNSVNQYIFTRVPKYLGASFGDIDTKVNTVNNIPIPNTEATIGIATLGGGSIDVRSGGTFQTPIGTFGTLNTSNLNITSGGNVDGRFRIMNGSLTVQSAGSFGTKDSTPVIEMGAAHASVSALGDVHLGAVFNPDNVRSYLFPTSGSSYRWNLTYNQDSSVSVTSLTGNLDFYGSTANLPSYFISTDSQLEITKRTNILPPTFSLAAAGNLNLSTKDFYLTPAPVGNLALYAGTDIVGSKITDRVGTVAEISSFTMADAPLGVYGWNKTNITNPVSLVSNKEIHYETVHLNDSADSMPVTIKAGTDISNLWLTLNKSADISAGNDISWLDFVGQNTQQGQVTRIAAGRNINQGYSTDYQISLANKTNPEYSKFLPAIVVGGPGELLVEAGSNIDLGNSRGILSIGNTTNGRLTGDANLTVVVGAKKELLPTDAVSFFYGVDGRNDHSDDALNGIQKAGDEYLTLKSGGTISGTPGTAVIGKANTGLPTVVSGTDKRVLASADVTGGSNVSVSGSANAAELSPALKRVDQAEKDIIYKWFDKWSTGSAGGDLNMTRSEIKSFSGDIRVLVKGVTNLGVTSLSTTSTETTGISTIQGGRIAMYSGGNINVNESRVMSYFGGNIVMWSDQGDINAGRGSKTTVNSPKKPVYGDPNDPSKITGYIYLAPSVGSGIRCLTYDPDGTGPLTAPDAGDPHIFAPYGSIDAGEAGIVGKQVFLGANQVLNTQNVFSTGPNKTVLSTSDSMNLGNLSGNSSLTDNSKMIEQSSSMASARDKAAAALANPVDDFMSKFLDVKVISFDMDASADEKEKEKKDRKK